MNRRNFFKTALGAIGAAVVAKISPAPAAALPPLPSTGIKGLPYLMSPEWGSYHSVRRPMSNAFITNLAPPWETETAKLTIPDHYGD